MNYCNQNGLTALHFCIDNNLVEAVSFLLNAGANPHIMDLSGQDACDKAKENDNFRGMPDFNKCSLRYKRAPKLSTGEVVDINKLPHFKE